MKYTSYLITKIPDRIRFLKMLRKNACLNLSEAKHCLDKANVPFLYPQCSMTENWLGQVKDGRGEHGFMGDEYENFHNSLQVTESGVEYRVVEIEILSEEEKELKRARQWYNSLGSNEQRFVDVLKKNNYARA